MKLGFIILAHNEPAAIRRLVDLLAVDGNQVVIHFDSSASREDQEAVAKLATAYPGQVRIISREHCVWGEWSLVSAVLLSLQEFEKMPETPDYVHLMSGADFPIRPIADFQEFLRRNPDRDFIECCDIAERPWVKGGLGRERLRFYYPFNFRTHRKTFDRLVRWQRKLKIRRKLPADLRPHMGSQWWTMRWSTCKKVTDFTKEHPEVPRYFKSTWIPDESYFQTLVAKLVPKKQIADLQLTFHHLTPSGRPYVFYNDHVRVLKKLPHFFARKISPQASEVFEKLMAPDLRPRRIPKCKHLVKARDLVQAKIDGNYRFTTNVPGFYQDKVLAPVKLSDEPVPVAQRPVILQSGITRPVVLLFLGDEKDLDGVGKMVCANPNLCWLGRPYAPLAIQTPWEQLHRMGLKTKSYKLRDFFSRQFVRYIVAATPAHQLPVAAILPLADHAELEFWGQIDLLVPLLVTTPSLKVHVQSNLRSAIFKLSPPVLAGLVNVDPGELPGVLEELARDQIAPGK